MASDKHGQPSSSSVASCSQASDSPSTYENMLVTSDTLETELSVYEHKWAVFLSLLVPHLNFIHKICSTP